MITPACHCLHCSCPAMSESKILKQLFLFSACMLLHIACRIFSDSRRDVKETLNIQLSRYNRGNKKSLSLIQRKKVRGLQPNLLIFLYFFNNTRNNHYKISLIMVIAFSLFQYPLGRLLNCHGLNLLGYKNLYIQKHFH